MDLSSRFVYVTNEVSNDVSAYRIAENGALRPVAGSPFPTGMTPGMAPVSVVVDPVGRFVYVANEGSSNVSAYRIAKNGALTPVAGSPFPTGIDSSSVAVDRFGRFVYVASHFSSNLSADRTAKTGP